MSEEPRTADLAVVEAADAVQVSVKVWPTPEAQRFIPTVCVEASLRDNDTDACRS